MTDIQAAALQADTLQADTLQAAALALVPLVLALVVASVAVALVAARPGGLRGALGVAARTGWPSPWSNRCRVDGPVQKVQPHPPTTRQLHNQGAAR